MKGDVRVKRWDAAEKRMAVAGFAVAMAIMTSGCPKRAPNGAPPSPSTPPATQPQAAVARLEAFQNYRDPTNPPPSCGPIDPQLILD